MWNLSYRASFSACRATDRKFHVLFKQTYPSTEEIYHGTHGTCGECRLAELATRAFGLEGDMGKEKMLLDEILFCRPRNRKRGIWSSGLQRVNDPPHFSTHENTRPNAAQNQGHGSFTHDCGYPDGDYEISQLNRDHSSGPGPALISPSGRRRQMLVYHSKRTRASTMESHCRRRKYGIS